MMSLAPAVNTPLEAENNSNNEPPKKKRTIFDFVADNKGKKTEGEKTESSYQKPPEAEKETEDNFSPYEDVTYQSGEEFEEKKTEEKQQQEGEKKYTEKELDAEAWELTNMLNNLSSFVNGFLLRKDPYECELSKRSKYKLYDILRPKILAYLKYRADSSLDFIQMMVFWFSLSSIFVLNYFAVKNGTKEEKPPKNYDDYQDFEVVNDEPPVRRAEQQAPQGERRGPGRPPGSKSKPKF